VDTDNVLVILTMEGMPQVAGLLAPAGDVTEQTRSITPTNPPEGTTLIEVAFPAVAPAATVIAPALLKAKDAWLTVIVAVPVDPA
jgi:hypothetical protein